MKPFSLIMLIGMLGNVLVQAQSAAEIARQKEIQEQLQIINSAIKDLMMTQDALQKRHDQLLDTVDSLQVAVRGIQKELDLHSTKFMTREQMAELRKAMKQLQSRQESIQKRILRDFEKLREDLLTLPTPLPPVSQPPPKTDESGFRHTIQAGETISKIVDAYNQHLKSEGKSGNITVKGVISHSENAGLEPRRLLVGNKIWLPIEAK